MRQLLAITFIFLSVSANAQHTRRTNPNTLAIEGLGRAGIASFQFDRAIADDVSAGVGFGITGLAGSILGSTTFWGIPFFMNYYLNRDARSFFATGGATATLAAIGSTALVTSPLTFNLGFGYESRSDSGFLFRGTLYGLITPVFAPWIGFTFGYSF